jgi:Ca2+-binding EF-hand superfamily protein
MIDENGDGVLTKEELTKGMDLFKQKFGLEGLFSDIDDLLKRIDLDGSGNVDIKEFITATINLKSVLNDKQLR